LLAIREPFFDELQSLSKTVPLYRFTRVDEEDDAED
jgi:hypothetical protein